MGNQIQMDVLKHILMFVGAIFCGYRIVQFLIFAAIAGYCRDADGEKHNQLVKRVGVLEYEIRKLKGVEK